MTPAHLYIHVPFCVRRCGYCDFAVTATREPPVDAWLHAIGAELRVRTREQGWTRPWRLDTIYIGGGTPSLLGTGALARLGALLREHAVWDAAAVEFTVEANPESFTPALARDWAEAGVNRVSLGVQTFHEPALRWMGRLHGPAGSERAVSAAREAAIANISVDLIFGLPDRLGRSWSTDIERALALGPTHVSLYGLTAEPATPLGRWVAEGREVLADEDRYAAEFLESAVRLGAAGYRQYEVSNFARPGCESRHNRAYWSHRPYLGLGPGAHSYLPPYRFWNVRSWADYQSRLERGDSAEAGRERPDAEQLRLEQTWLALRTDDGIAMASLTAAQRAKTRERVAGGLAEQNGSRLRLTWEGWLLLDRLAVELESSGDVAGRHAGDPADAAAVHTAARQVGATEGGPAAGVLREADVDAVGG